MGGVESLRNEVLKEWVHSFVREAEIRIEKSFARPVDTSKLMILPYRGYGTAKSVRVLGRVLEDRGVTRGVKPASRQRNLIDTVKRLMSGEVGGAKVRLTSGSGSVETESDEEGYIDAEVELGKPSGDLWEVVRVELLDPVPNEPVHALAECLVPRSDAEFGIISDIDDTVVETGTTNKLKMFATVALNNAKTRTPFEDVGPFYEALQQRTNGKKPRNPLFYVSSSPWNFFDLLEEFFRLHEIPVGPLMLQDFGVDEQKLIQAEHDDHKLEQIEAIMTTYPNLPFVLIGDSGLRDAEIYAKVIEDLPDRVRAVYIRDVTPETRGAAIRELSESVRDHGVDLELVATTTEAWNHARRTGLTK